MNPIHLSEYLSTVLRNDLRLSLMIWGAPGIGKSSIVAQAAERAGVGFIDVRLSQLAPTDLRGLPVPERLSDGGGIARWYPPEFLPRSGTGVLFLDELNMAAPSMQGVAQQLILDRRVGSYELPDGWFVWAAGNRKEDRASVFDMPAPLANRFVHLEVTADLDSFKTFAVGHGVSERVVAFLSFRPDMLHKLDSTRPAWPSPRSWVMADAMAKAGLEVDGAIGPGAAAEFRSFLKVYEALPDLAAILKGRGQGVKDPTEPSLRYATVVGLAMRARDGREGHNAMVWAIAALPGEWAQALFTDLYRAIMGTPSQGEWVTLMMGDPAMKPYFARLGKLRGALASLEKAA